MALTRVLTTGLSNNVITSDKLADETLVTRSLVPEANNTYDLGTANSRFKDLYLSGNTIVLGEATLSVANGVLKTTIGGEDVALSTPRYITVSQTGTFTGPLTSNTRYYPPVDIEITKVYASVGTAPASGLVFQLRKNGANVESFTISTGEYKLAPNTQSISVTANDYLSLAIVSGTASELTVELEYLIV